MDSPKHPYDGINDNGTRDYEPVQEFIKRKTNEERFDNILRMTQDDQDVVFAQMDTTEQFQFVDYKQRMQKIDDEYRQETFGPLDPEETQMKDEIEMAVDPGHYKSVACGKQYIELVTEILKDQSGIESHLLGQSYKYMMRYGKKDAKEQDAQKAAFYLMCLVMYAKRGWVKADTVQDALKKL